MKKEIDFLMIENWEDFDVKSPMFTLTKAGFSKIEAGGILVHLMRCLRRSHPDGVTSAEDFRSFLELIDLPQDKIDGVLATPLFAKADGDNLLFAPCEKLMNESYDYMVKEVRHMRAVKSGKASALAANKGRFKAGNKAACKHKEKVEEEKAEEVVSSYV